MRATGPDDPDELAHRRGRVVHVAQEIGEGQPGEARVLEGQLLGAALAELDAALEAGGRDPAAAFGQHLGALVDADDAAPVPAGELDRDRARSAGDVEHRVAGAGVDAGDEERAPARVLPEAEEVGVAVVRPGERREELAGGAVALRGWGDHLAIVAPREPRGGAERRPRGRAGARRRGRGGRRGHPGGARLGLPRLPLRLRGRRRAHLARARRRGRAGRRPHPRPRRGGDRRAGRARRGERRRRERRRAPGAARRAAADRQPGGDRGGRGGGRRAAGGDQAAAARGERRRTSTSSAVPRRSSSRPSARSAARRSPRR